MTLFALEMVSYVSLQKVLTLPLSVVALRSFISLIWGWSPESPPFTESSEATSPNIHNILL